MVKLTIPGMYPASPMSNDDNCPRVYLPNSILEGQVMQPGAPVKLTFVGKVSSMNEMELCVELEQGEMSASKEEADKK